MNNDLRFIGIDLGKNWFHAIGIDAVGKPLLRRKLNRMQLATFAAQLPRCVVAMESCPGSQYWGRRFAELGHDVRLIPAQFVKPYLKSNKNDFNDATAIAEAATRATMRCVPLKSEEQLELQAMHRIRQRLIVERTALVNQMRALLLERGIAVPVGRIVFGKHIGEILADAENGVSVRLRELLHRSRARWSRLDQDIEEMTSMIAAVAESSELCRRVSTVPGVGPIVSTAMVAAVGNARMFRRGRDMAAWCAISRFGTARFPDLGPTLHGLPAAPRGAMFTRLSFSPQAFAP